MLRWHVISVLLLVNGINLYLFVYMFLFIFYYISNTNKTETEYPKFQSLFGYID